MGPSFPTCHPSRNLRSSFTQSPYLSTMIMRDVLAIIVMSAGERFPVLAIYFKSLSTKEKRKGQAHERDRYFEVWTSYGPAGYRWLPRNGVGHPGSLWCLVRQGHHRSPRFLLRGPGRCPVRVCREAPDPPP